MIEDKIKENREINLNNCNENNLFDIIILLFTKLFSKYIFCHYDDNNIYSEFQKRRINELLLVVGTSCFNFYYGENSPLNFSIIDYSIEKLNKNYYFEKELYNEYENSINHVKNYRKSKQTYYYQSYFNNFRS
jgi:hypothetical protein